MKKNKKKIIVISAIVVTLLIALTLGIFISGCNEKPKAPNTDIILEDPNDSSSENSSGSNENIKLDTKLENTIEASKYSPMNYSILVPEWESLPDYHYEQLGNNEEFKMNKEWVVLDNNNNFNFYSRGFISEDKDVYLFVAEYLGNVKFPNGAQLGIDGHSRASETIMHIERNLIPKYKWDGDNLFGSDWTEEELVFEEGLIQKWRFTNGYYTDVGLTGNDRLARGYCLLGYEIPIVIYAFDASEDQIHADEIKELTLNMMNSFSVIKNP